jgi:phytoene synthase
MQDAFGYCETLVRAADKDRYLASLFAPVEHRASLHALYAFNAELARVRDHISGPLPGEIRLQWWRDVLSGTARGEVAGNPVASALLATIELHGLALPRLDELIDARTFDLYDEPMARVPDLESYARATSSVLIELAARILGGNGDPTIARAARHAGIAYGIVRLLADFPLHAARGQLFVPADLLARHQVEPADIHARRATPGLRTALSDLRALARIHLTEAVPVIVELPEQVMPALLAVALVRPTLDRMERGGEPFTPAEIPQWRRQWLLWRAAYKRARVAG